MKHNKMKYIILRTQSYEVQYYTEYKIKSNNIRMEMFCSSSWLEVRAAGRRRTTRVGHRPAPDFAAGVDVASSDLNTCSAAELHHVAVLQALLADLDLVHENPVRGFLHSERVKFGGNDTTTRLIRGSKPVVAAHDCHHDALLPSIAARKNRIPTIRASRGDCVALQGLRVVTAWSRDTFERK